MAELTIKLVGQDLVSGMFKNATSGLKGLASAAVAPARAVGSLVSVGVKGLGAIGLAGLGLQTVAASAKGLGGALGVGLNSELENTRAQFLAFTKDANLTDKILADLRKEANATPFSFAELAKATASLIPASKATRTPLNDLIKTSELLAALNPAEGLEGAAFSLREALSGDFVSIVERFNLPRERLNALKKQGVPAVKAINQVLSEMGVDASLVANMGQTLTGRWSTFNDTLADFRRTLSAPLFEQLKRGLMLATAFLEENRVAIDAWAQVWGDRIGKAAAAVIDGVALIGGALRDLAGFIQTGDLSESSLLAPFTQSLGIARDAALTFIAAVKGEWGGAATTSIDPIVRSVGQLGNFLRTYVIPTVMAFGQLFKSVLTGDVGGALNALYEIIIGSRVRLAQAFLGWIQPLIPPLLAELTKLGQSMLVWIQTNAPIFLEHFITNWLPAFVGWLADAGTALLPHLTLFLDRLKEWVNANGAPLLEAFIAHWVPVFVGWLGEAAKQIIPRLLMFQAEIVKWVATEGIPAFLQMGIDLGGAIVMGIIRALDTIKDQIRAALIAAGVPLPGQTIPPAAVTQRPPVTATAEQQQMLDATIAKFGQLNGAMDKIINKSGAHVDEAYRILTAAYANT